MNRHPSPSLQQPLRRLSQAGITLVETTVVTCVLAIVTGLVAPSFDGAIQRRHLEGAAAQLETDIHYTRMLAVASNTPLRISFESGTDGSCYVIHSGAANQCSCASEGAAVCQGAAQAERSVRFPVGGPVSLTSNSRSVVFDPTKGTSTPTATMRLTARNGMAVHQVMNVMGRVRSCSPAPAVSGYRAC
jgi:type IV fimbrial biogenesis protein FimT